METPSFDGSSDDGGGGFLLGGTAQLDEDPENPANDVIRIRTNMPPFFGTVSRTVNVKIDKLDNMLEFKAWFYVGVAEPVGKSCVGGAPRLQLAIDLNGDGSSDGNAFGYFGPSPSFTLCPQNTWLYEDLTGGDGITGLGPIPSTGFMTPNEETEWDLTQFFCPMGTLPPGPPSDPCITPQPFVINWSLAEQVIGGAFPNHLVCTVALVDDTFGVPLMSGVAYYDLFSAGTATWTDESDIAGRGFAQGCGRPDDGDDDDDDGDHDHDGDDDDDDDEYDDDRRERWGDDG
jgi:hypothetical protein